LGASVFLQYAADAFFINGSAGFSRDDYDLSRRIISSGFDATATASPSGRRTDFSVTAGREFRAGGWQIVPHAGLLYSTWKLDDFSETGADGANMTFTDASVRSFRGRAGVEFSHRSPGGRVVPRASLVWWHEFKDNRSFRARFAGIADDYNLPGRGAERNVVQGAIAIDAAMSANAVFSLGVEGIWGSDLRAGPTFSAGIRWGF